MSDMVEFYHGALSDTYEEQANKQGFTFGDNAEFVQNVGFGLVAAHVHGCITDGEYDRILRRFQTKVLVKNLKRMKNSEEAQAYIDEKHRQEDDGE